MNKVFSLLVFIILCEAVGLLGTPFTASAVPTWYAFLNKPSFAPPNWVFGPVWTLLYLMMGISAYIVWSKGIQKKQVKKALSIFTLQLALNFAWSILFFGLRSPILGLADIVLLWLSILATVITFSRVSRTASILLIPYLAWVSFASILNLFIVLLNP